MDVRCECCNTEYEFDDALVSWRGTTVKCTSCGHKFRIAHGNPESGEDFWKVRVRDGKTIIFTSLRELQKAIQAQQVKATDKLSRGGLPPKPIEQIPELLSFFERSKTTTTAPGLGPERPPLETFPDFPAPPAVLPSPPRPLRSIVTTLAGTGTDEAEAAVVQGSVVPVEELTKPAAEPPPSAPFKRVDVDVDFCSTLEGEDAGAPASSIVVERASATELAGARRPVLALSTTDAERGEDSGASKRFLQIVPSSIARPLSVGIVVAAGAILLIALLVAVGVRQHESERVETDHPAPVASVDSKVVSLLEQGEKAFVDGDIERAKENFDKATALSNNDPRVLVDVARLAAARADVPWLRVRLLPEDATDERRITQEDLRELAAASRRDSEQALQALPDNLAALLTKIDALRTSGDQDGARALVAKLSLRASSPEDAYVLAALDLAEEEPPWAIVIERLRVAAGAELGPGRARAALIYALARSGDASSARVELDRLANLPRIHPLFALLRAFTERAAAKENGSGR